MVNETKMRHLGLFEGIGGFSLAARWMGWETMAWVEINKFCQQVLKKNFPEAKGYGDIKEFNGTPYRGAIDILTGGFPCQPFSVAGKRKGKEDHRYLWPEMLRIIREVQPPYIVGENVHGIINWSGGLVFEQVCSDLENEGYQVQPVILPACSIGAWHRRDRAWFIAYSDNFLHKRELDATGNPTETRRGKGTDETKGQTSFRQRLWVEPSASGSLVTDTNSQGLQKRQINTRMEGQKDGEYKREISSIRDEWITEPAICGKDHGIPNRVDRIKALGNAIVPQVAFEIFKAIEQVKLNNG